jgi:hypothetical protein
MILDRPALVSGIRNLGSSPGQARQANFLTSVHFFFLRGFAASREKISRLRKMWGITVPHKR